MKTIRIAILLIALAASATFAQKKSKDAVLLTIGGQSIPLSDFRYLYEKNYGNTDTAYNEASVREYLDLYIKFKLKVVEAKARKMHESEKFSNEFEKYRKQLAKPYLSDRSITEGLIKDAYERYKQEVRASHILARVKNWGNPEDTLKAYQKILDIKKRIEGGEDFATLAMELSEDPSAKTNKGDLGYFTSMQMVFEFEDVAYKLPKGSLSDPVKTQFGYHLLNVVDKIPARGSRKVSHIMIRYTQGMEQSDSLEAIRKVNEIAQKLNDGGNWDDLCKQFSDDRNSRDKGGALPWFSTGRMIPAFSEASFKLKEQGDVSEPIKTSFGWHIIRLDSTKGIPEFKELEPTIKQRVSKDVRAQLSKTLFLKKLKKDNNLYEYTKLHEKVFSVFDSTLNTATWNFDPSNKLVNKTLFKLNKDKFLIRGFYKYVVENQVKNEAMTPNQLAKNMYQKYLDVTVMKYEEEHLTTKYPDYANLLREYREGILLFDIMDQEVWGKSIKDTTGLAEYFESHRDNYQWKKRAKASIFSVEDPSLLAKIKQELDADTFMVASEDSRTLVFSLNDTLVDRPKRTVIDRLILSLKKNPAHLVKIEGYYVEGETNEILQSRLNEIQKYFKGFRIEPGRVMISNLGLKEGTVNPPANAGGSIALTLYSTSPKALEKKYNKEDALALQVTEGWFEQGEEGPLNDIEWKEGSYTVEHNGRKTYIVIEKIEEPRAKELNETKGMVISDYQNYLEAQWIEELKKKYPVKVMDNELEKIIKK